MFLLGLRGSTRVGVGTQSASPQPLWVHLCGHYKCSLKFISPLWWYSSSLLAVWRPALWVSTCLCISWGVGAYISAVPVSNKHDIRLGFMGVLVFALVLQSFHFNLQNSMDQDFCLMFSILFWRSSVNSFRCLRSLVIFMSLTIVFCLPARHFPLFVYGMPISDSDSLILYLLFSRSLLLVGLFSVYLHFILSSLFLYYRCKIIFLWYGLLPDGTKPLPEPVLTS